MSRKGSSTNQIGPSSPGSRESHSPSRSRDSSSGSAKSVPGYMQATRSSSVSKGSGTPKNRKVSDKKRWCSNWLVEFFGDYLRRYIFNFMHDLLWTHRLVDIWLYVEIVGCFPLCQRFRKFRSEFKWKGPFRFLPTGIFGITSGGGLLISVGIFRSKFAVPFLTNRFFALVWELGNDKKWQELFLLVGAV